MPKEDIPQEIQDLKALADKIYESPELKKFLFAHTKSESEFINLRRALTIIRNTQMVQWTGKSGSRIPVSMEV